MSIDQTLTSLERLADLDLDQLRQLVGLVEYDADADAFPVSGWDAIVWSVGNANQAALLFQHVFGMELVAQFGPETGNRDHQAYVLRSGALRFVLKGGSTQRARFSITIAPRRRDRGHRAGRAGRRPLHRARSRPGGARHSVCSCRCHGRPGSRRS